MLRKYTNNSCGIEDWQSTIRHCVSVHEKYHDLVPWTGQETADIVFKDQASLLTGIMVSYGYLTWDWQGKTPTYFLEVKSTTSSCDTRFFMSKAQVRRVSLLSSSLASLRIDNGYLYSNTVRLRYFHVNNNDVVRR